MTTKIFVTTSFIGQHRWEDAPEQFDYLRNWHRHVFHVRLEIPVSHNNRDIEFINLKKEIDQYLRTRYEMLYRFPDSCEMIAQNLLNRFDASLVEVSEDGENGAVIVRETEKEALPSQKIRTKCFLGTEAEGPWKGRHTLFVPGNVSPEDLQSAIDYASGMYEMVYYGAGNDRQLRKDTLATLVNRFAAEPRMVTLEVDKRDHIPLETKFMVVSLYPWDLSVVDYIKVFAGGSLYWIGRGNCIYETKLDDPLYAQDRGI